MSKSKDTYSVLKFNNSSLINSVDPQLSTQIGESNRGELAVDLKNINSETLGVYEQSTQRFSSNVKIETFDGTDAASYLFEDVTANSRRLIDLGKPVIPSEPTLPVKRSCFSDGVEAGGAQ